MSNQTSPIKPGIKTSEFLIVVVNHLVCFALLALIWAGYLTPTFEYAEEILLVAALGPQALYTRGRTALKDKQLAQGGNTPWIDRDRHTTPD